MFNPQEIHIINERFAHYFNNNQGEQPSNDLIEQTCMEIDHWYGHIAVPITWVKGREPYNTFEQMVNDIQLGTFKVHDYIGDGYQSNIWGMHYNKMRAVHDYYGHYQANNAFGIIGELSAYGVHIGMFSKECMPLIFNEIVLTNATREIYGTAQDKFVPFHT